MLIFVLNKSNTVVTYMNGFLITVSGVWNAYLCPCLGLAAVLSMKKKCHAFESIIKLQVYMH